MSVRFFKIGDGQINATVVCTQFYKDKNLRPHPSGTLILGDAHFGSLYSAIRSLQHIINSLDKETDSIATITKGAEVAKQVLSLPGKAYSGPASNAIVENLQSVILNGQKRARKPEKKELSEKAGDMSVRGSKGGINPQATMNKMEPVLKRLSALSKQIGGSREDRAYMLRSLQEYQTRFCEHHIREMRKFFAANNEEKSNARAMSLAKALPSNLPLPYLGWLPKVKAKICASSGCTSWNTVAEALDLMRISYFISLDLFAISCGSTTVKDDVMGELIMTAVATEAPLALSGHEYANVAGKLSYIIEDLFLTGKASQEKVKDELKKLLSDIDEIIKTKLA